jgi:hypothetical protein
MLTLKTLRFLLKTGQNYDSDSVAITSIFWLKSGFFCEYMAKVAGELAFLREV